MSTTMNTHDANNSNLGTVFMTYNGRRYAMLNVRNFRATSSVVSTEVRPLGKMMASHKPTGMVLKFTMTVIKVSPVFDEILDEFKRTGLLPTFDVQVSSNDPASSTGTDSKIYRGCMIDGDVDLSMLSSDSGIIEQTISGYCEDYDIASKYTAPGYM